MLPGFIISVVTIVIILQFVDIEDISEALQKANYHLIPLAVVLLVLSMVFRAAGWRVILGERLTLGKTFLTINEGYLMNNILPFRMGEIGRALLVSSNAKMSFWEVIATIVVERVFDVAIMSGIILGSIPFVIGGDLAIKGGIISSLLVLVGLSVLYLLTKYKEWTLGIFDKLFTRVPKFHDFGREKLESVLAGFSTLVDLQKFITAFFWILMCWVFNVAWYYVMMIAFIPEAKPIWGIFTVGLTGLGVSLPSTPGYVGLLEGTIVLGLSLFGVSKSVATAYGVFTHFLYLVITISIGAYGLGKEGESIGKLYRKLRERKEAREKQP